MTKRALMHIPDGHMLTTHEIGYWIERFQDMCRARPTEVVLPGIDFLGPTYDSLVQPPPARLEAGNLLPDWIRQVREALGPQVRVWGGVLSPFPFLEVETVMVEDQYGTKFDANACISKPTVQKIADAFVGEMGQFGIDGIVFDATDIYPNSGSNVTLGIQNTCFCVHCLRELRIAGWSHDRGPFVGASNISRSVLKLTETGAAHLEARHEWIRDADAAALVRLSAARGFLKGEQDDNADAAMMLGYLSARALVTATSLRRLGQKARESKLAVAIILGDEHFDVTQATDLATLVKSEAAGEYWLPSIESEALIRQEVHVAQYLFGRASYIVNGFFERIATADSVVAETGANRFVELIRMAARRMQANKLVASAVFGVELTDEYSGFVGVPIRPGDVVDFVAGLARASLGQVVPAQVIDQIIDQVRIASPAR